MSTPRDFEDRLNELLAQVSDDGQLSPAQQAELVELLRNEPAARAQYLDHLHLHAMLHWVESAPPAQGTLVAAREDAGDLLPAVPATVPMPAQASYLPEQLDFRSHPLRFTAAVAAITVAAWMLLIAFVAVEAPPVVEHREVPIVAKVTGLIDTHWVDGEHYSIGLPLRAGKRLELESGLAEITFYDGARVVMEGPCRLWLAGTNSSVLQRGHLSARVPPKAVGFTVTTPSAVVVDLSTEFALRVDAKGDTDVHVFHGRVRVERLAERTEDDQPRSLYLLADQAMRIDHRGGTRRLPIDPEERRALDSRERFIAYRNHEIAEGQQVTLTTLGHDFVVERTIVVSQLGVFDSGANGLRRIITAELWARDDLGTPDNFHDDQPLQRLATLSFTPVNPGTLVESSRFKPLPAEIVLSPGSYTIVAYGYGPHEPFGNSKFPAEEQYKSLDDGRGALKFVGTARFGDAKSQPHTTFPLSVGQGPANRYRAGTFEFLVPGRVDPPQAQEDPAPPADGDEATDAAPSSEVPASPASTPKSGNSKE